MKTVVISQPTYLPWPGYFRLIKEADVFVFLDTVQFERQSWQSRNRIKTPTNWKWLTVPVKHESLFQPIKDVKIDNDKPWQKNHWNSLDSAYRKAPYFRLYAPLFKSVFEKDWQNLSELNISVIRELSSQLNLAPVFLKSSELNITGTRTERLINICRKLDANRYVSSIGAAEYIKQDGGKQLFEAEGIELTFLEYKQPVYPQLFGEYIPGLSFVDLLFNCGPTSSEVLFDQNNTQLTTINKSKMSIS